MKFLNNFKSLYSTISEQLVGVVLGVSITALMALITWCFAYFGYIELGLPKRFDYEIINKQIESELPSGYSYNSIAINNFREASTQSIVVIAKSNNIGSVENYKSVKSDIIIIFDKNNDGYRVSYKFQPDTELPLHVRQHSIIDLDNNGTKDIFIGWSELGAHWSDTALTVFAVQSEKVKIYGLPKLSNLEYPDDYNEERIANVFDSTEFITTNRSDHFAIKDGKVAAINRSFNTCYACVNEDLWHVSYLNYWQGDNILVQTDTMSNILGIDAINKELEKNGYQ